MKTESTVHEEEDGRTSLYTYFSKKKVYKTEQKDAFVTVDYDKNGKIIGVEVLW